MPKNNERIVNINPERLINYNALILFLTMILFMLAFTPEVSADDWENLRPETTLELVVDANYYDESYIEAAINGANELASSGVTIEQNTLPEQVINTLTVVIGNGDNVRFLGSRNIDSSFPRGNTEVIGYITDGPLQSIASGTWLVLEGGEHVVFSGVVTELDGSSVTDVEAATTAQYTYDGTTYVPVVPEVEAEPAPTPDPNGDDDEVETPTPEPTGLVTPETIGDSITVEYPRFTVIPGNPTTVSYEMITLDNVDINESSLMAIPFGVVNEGEFPVVDEFVEYLNEQFGHRNSEVTMNHAAISGIFVDTYSTGGMNIVVLAFPTETGAWETMQIQLAAGRWHVMRPVNASLEATETDFMRYDEAVRFQDDLIIGDVDLPIGSHIIFGVTAPTSAEPTYGGSSQSCGGLETPDAVEFLQEGNNECRQTSSSYLDWGTGAIRTYGHGTLYAVETSVDQ